MSGSADGLGSRHGKIPVLPDSPDREPGLGFHMLGSRNKRDRPHEKEQFWAKEDVGKTVKWAECVVLLVRQSWR